MQKPIRDYREPSKLGFALAVAAYRGEQEKTKAIVQQVLGKYGKPQMTLKEHRAMLDKELGDVSLSEEIINMREEGY